MDIHIQQETEQVELDVERQKKAREYARLRRRLSGIRLALSTVGILILLVSPLGTWLSNLLRLPAWTGWQPLAGWYPLQIVAYFLIVYLVYEIVTTPLNYYSGYILPHRYGLSTLSLRGWIGDRLKSLALDIVLEALVLAGIYALLAWLPNSWWLVAALVLIFFSVVLANLAPVLITPLFYKFSPLPQGELTERLLALTRRANTQVRGVFTMHLSAKTTAANAALMGLGNTRRIVVGDTMLDRYTTDEIEVVLAHELGHHVHKDIWRLLLSQSFLMLAGLYLVNVVFHWAVETQHYYPNIASPATLPLLFVLLGIFGLVVLPLSNGLSRAIEYQADEYALQATHKVNAFKGAMTRLSNQNLAEIEPSPIVEFLFYSHPSIQKRLKHADEFVIK